jgi:hypothetical protein
VKREVIILMIIIKSCAVQITKLVEYIDRKEDPLIWIVRMHQHIINSAVLQTAGCLKAEIRRGTRQIKDSLEKTKNGEGKRCTDSCHVT